MISCPRCNSENLRKNGFGRDNLQHYFCKDCQRDFPSLPEADEELVRENVRYKKEKQRFQDSNRIERKAFREYARLENALSEYNSELIGLLKTNQFSKLTKHHSVASKSAGIFHLSDTHFNELVQLKFNTYDFNVASKRLEMDVDISKKMFKAWGVKNVLFAITGDLLNSDRRLDELLNMATNRSKATFLVVDLLKSVILDLQKEFNITVACVSGNESRVKDEHGFSDLLLTDNYDFTIFNMLKYLFADAKGVEFHSGHPAEEVIKIAGKNILMLHGDQSTLNGSVERGVTQLCGKYAAKGIDIDFVIFGHLHSARIGEYFARSSSLVGANAYSEHSLHLVSRASQNIHIITEGGQIHSMKIDLQDASDYKGYNFDKSLEAYHPKSAQKLHSPKTILEIRI